MNDSVKISKRLIALSEEIVKANADYVYDPKHVNRPHEGGNWHKTEKGWSKKEKRTKESLTPEQQKLIQDARSEEWYERRAAAQNINTPVEALIALVDDEESVVFEEALKNPNVPQSILRMKSKDEKYTDAISCNPNCPNDILDELSKSKWPRTRSGVGGNSNASKENLETLANDDEREVREAVASNKNISPELLEKLSKDKEWPVRMEVARNKNTSIQTLDDLSKENNHYVREEVIKNPNTSGETLKKLENSDDETRELIAKHPNTPPEVLKRFANDSRNGVLRGNVARNPNTPKDVLEDLAKDKDKYVSEGAKKTLSMI